MTDATRTSFDIGRVIGNTFEVLGRNFVPFALGSLVLAGVPAFIQQLIGAGERGQFSFTFFMIGIGFAFLKAVLSFVLQGALVTGAISDLNGKQIDLGSMLSRGAAVAMPLFGLAILEGLAVGLGLILLLIPGLILVTVWAVTVPSLVIERTGVFGAFERSADLTRGRRWLIFALFLVFALVSLVVGGIGSAIIGVTVGGLIAFTTGGAMVAAVVMLVLTTIMGALSAAGVGALYFELRLTKEGVAPQAILDTFN